MRSAAAKPGSVDESLSEARDAERDLGGDFDPAEAERAEHPESFDPGVETGYLRRGGRDHDLPVEAGAAPFDPGPDHYDRRRARRARRRQEKEERKRRARAEKLERERRAEAERLARERRERAMRLERERADRAQHERRAKEQRLERERLERAAAAAREQRQREQALAEGRERQKRRARAERQRAERAERERAERERAERDRAVAEQRRREERERAERKRLERERASTEQRRRAERERPGPVRLKTAPRPRARPRPARLTSTPPSRRSLGRPTAKAGIALAAVVAAATGLGSLLGLPVPLSSSDPSPEGSQVFLTGAAALAALDGGTPIELTQGPYHPVVGDFGYGEAPAKFNASRGGRKHEGQDVFAEIGTPLVAVRDGVVLDGRGGRNFYASGGGHTAVIYSPIEDRSFVYLHMHKPALVKVGEQVRAGQPIGLLGCTGSCGGPHLHFEVREGRADFGAETKPIDPLPLLKRWPRRPTEQ